MDLVQQNAVPANALDIYFLTFFVLLPSVEVALVTKSPFITVLLPTGI